MTGFSGNQSWTDNSQSELTMTDPRQHSVALKWVTNDAQELLRVNESSMKVIKSNWELKESYVVVVIC